MSSSLGPVSLPSRPTQALLLQLWGNADVAKSALSVTVHRLRKVLNCDAAVVVAGGRFSLCEALVWTDIGTLGELCAQITALPAQHRPSDLYQLAGALLDLYRGPFCDDSDDSWMLPERERARKLFLAAAAQLGERLEAASQWSAGLDLYRRALEAEPLSEANYRGAMRCAHALEGRAAAFAAYRRCRETLSILLGIAPSQDTEQLAATLGLK